MPGYERALKVLGTYMAFLGVCLSWCNKLYSIDNEFTCLILGFQIYANQIQIDTQTHERIDVNESNLVLYNRCGR